MEERACANTAMLQAVPASGLDTLRQRLMEIDKRANDILARARHLADTAFGPVPENTGMGTPVSGPSLGGAVEDLAHTISRLDEALSRL